MEAQHCYLHVGKDHTLLTSRRMCVCVCICSCVRVRVRLRVRVCVEREGETEEGRDRERQRDGEREGKRDREMKEEGEDTPLTGRRVRRVTTSVAALATPKREPVMEADIGLRVIQRRMVVLIALQEQP